jgi:hypothetical protein
MMFVGIDVSKRQLDVALRPGAEHWTVSNDEADVVCRPVTQLRQRVHRRHLVRARDAT